MIDNPMKLVVTLVALGAAACSRTEPVADGPIDVGPAAERIRFSRTIVSGGPKRELCFEFQRPGDSHAASGLEAILVQVDGTRERFGPAIVDRRGESLVCLCGEARRSPATSVEYDAVLLSSQRPVRLRQIRWWSGS